ncbi:MAG: glutamate-5-semialdehyde dehydrogenase [Actinobacteria bacterium]|nr:glutamate-5-semialdehyde dehydrogenase [Actinomycetota bacterium]
MNAQIIADAQDLGRRAKTAARIMATASTAQKNEALLAAADALLGSAAAIIEANNDDLDAARSDGMADGPLDRLRLDERRIEAMAGGLRQVASLADPVGEKIEEFIRPNGLKIEKMRVPLGVVCVIYENRPNVTSDAAGICLKSGNAALLRGSSSALQSNKAVAQAMRSGLAAAGLPKDGVVLVEDVSRDMATAVMQLNGYVDCLIPRGGPSLIQSILDNASVPYVIDGDGNCQIYVDKSADLDRAVDIIINAKTQRPSVCNAAESLIVHRDIAAEFLPTVLGRLQRLGVEIRGDETTAHLVDGVVPATDDDFATEFLDLIISVGVVDGVQEAIDHINEHSSGHTEAILATDREVIDRFVTGVDSAATVVNASTRFTDGEQFGFGAEIGISTQKLHARGPMALRELTSYKYVVWGDGQIRG